MRHLLVAAALVLGALLVTATLAGYLENQAVKGNSNTGSYTPPSAPSVGKPSMPEQSRSSLNVVWRRSGK